MAGLITERAIEQGNDMMIDGQRASDIATSTILAYYAAFNRGDWEAMLALLTEDVAHEVNQGATEQGRDAFRTFLQRMERSYKEQLKDICVMATDNGRRGASEYVVHGQYLAADEGLPPANGQRYVLPGGAFFDLRDGRIARVTNYYNLNDWLRQIGSA